MAKRAPRDDAEALDAMNRLVAAGPESDDASSELFIDSEGTVDLYLEAAAMQSSTMPTRQELGESCFWMAWLVGLFGVKEHQQLIVELLSPSVGIAMFEIQPRVAALRQACDVTLARLASEQNPKALMLLPEEDIPF